MNLKLEDINQLINNLRESLTSDEELRNRFKEDSLEVAREFGFPDEYLQAITNDLEDNELTTVANDDMLLQGSKAHMRWDATYTDLWLADIPTGFKLTLNHEACDYVHDNHSDAQAIIEFAIGCCGSVGMAVALLILVEKLAIKRADNGKGVHFNINILDEAAMSLCVTVPSPMQGSCFVGLGLTPRSN